jgi:flagellar biosynthesis protein FlhB
LTDEIIAHALAMLRFHVFKSRVGVDFSELIKAGLPNFLCCSPETLRLHLRRMNQTNDWKSFFSFTEAVNLDSISFGDDCEPRKTVLVLLNSGNDTWL